MKYYLYEHYDGETCYKFTGGVTLEEAKQAARLRAAQLEYEGCNPDETSVGVREIGTGNEVWACDADTANL